MAQGVMAIRIYYDEITMTPWADLKMADGVIETICWTNLRERKKYEAGINGYTLFYDEREKRTWEEWK